MQTEKNYTEAQKNSKRTEEQNSKKVIKETEENMQKRETS